MKVFSLGLAICAALAVTTASVEAKGTICETGSGFADTGDSYSSETPVATTATVSSSSGSDATQVAASSSTAGSDADQVAGSSSTTSSSDAPVSSSTGSDVADSSSTTSGSDAPVSSSTGGDVAGSDAIQQTDSSSSTGSDATQVAGSDAVQQTDSSSTAGSATTPAATSSPAGSDANQVAASSSTAGSDATQVTSSGSNHSDDTPVTSTSSTGSDGTTASQNNGDSTTQGSEGKNDTAATPINNKGDDTTSSGSDASDVNKNSSGATPTQGETPTASSSNSKGDSSATASSSLNDSTGQTGSKPAGSGSRTLQVDVGSIDFTTTSNAEESDSTDSDDTTQYAAPTVSPASDSASGSSADSTPTQTSSGSASSQASASASSDDSPVQQTSISGSSASSNPIQQTSISASGSSDSSVSIEGSASASSADSTPTPTADSSSITSSASTSASESAASSASASVSASASASESSSSSSSSFSKVTRLGVRVQGDMPEWNKKHKRFVSAYYETFDEKYRAVLDTVNMASVEGALKYVQAECINASVITDCERKNNIKYVVFYQTTTVQPTAAMEYYVNATDERNFAVESCPFMAMDGGQCDPKDDGTFPDVCNQYIGAGDQPDLGFCVGGTLQDNEAIAPYPHNYWFSFPNSCPQKLWDDKTDSCRKKYAGGMCPLGVEPDGVTCTFTYEILGYILLDDVVGITSMTNPTTGKNYADYYEFCKAGGVEFSVSIVTGLVSLLTGILSSVVDLVEGLEFWANPGDSDANAERVEKLVSAYDTLVASNPTTSDGGLMRVLPTEDELAALNPSCFENSPLCAESEFGCKRSYLSQICQLCTSDDSGCEKP